MGTSTKDLTLARTVVNPWSWSVPMGFNQGEIVTGYTRTLFCAGQASVDAEGALVHSGDMAAQVAQAVDNLEAVLGEGGMSLANVVRFTIFTTDVDLLLQHYGVLGSRTRALGVAPPSTLVGVTRLAYPELMVEIEATAVQ